jgi:hypothetical protein
MKITKQQIKQLIKEELSKVLNEGDGWYEYYLYSPYEGIYSESEKTLKEAEKEIKHALSTFYRRAQLVAIWGPQGELVKLGEGVSEEEARRIHVEYSK